jgi:hypothetical protein
MLFTCFERMIRGWRAIASCGHNSEGWIRIMALLIVGRENGNLMKLHLPQTAVAVDLTRK